MSIRFDFVLRASLVLIGLLGLQWSCADDGEQDADDSADASAGTDAGTSTGTDTDAGTDTDTDTDTGGDTDSDTGTDTDPMTTEEVFVDGQIEPDSCGTYDVATRSCAGGAEAAYRSFAGASAVATAGFKVSVRGGTYSTPLVVQHSGTPKLQVVFARYGDEEVLITGEDLSPAIDISEQSYVVIDGFVVENVWRWLHAVRTHHSTVVRNTFKAALDTGGSSKTGVFFQEATFNRILDNTIEDSTQDNLSFHACDHNLIEGNTIREAEHTLWAIKCGNFNVVRNNYFHNEIQKIGEIYDCHESGFDHEITKYDATKHNLVEHNEFAFAVKYYSTSGGNGIQNAGQHGIIRRNLFYDNNSGVGLQRYSEEAEFDTHNRIYHNLFYNNECGGVSTGSGIEDNLLQNNILFANSSCEREGVAQVTYRELGGFSFIRNDIRGPDAGVGIIQELFEELGTLGDFESEHPELFSNNLELDPMFEDPEHADFRLKPESQMIDAGMFLTTTVGSAQGTEMVVADATYFFDGYAIEGESGDLIQVAGQSDTAQVLAIDYASNTLTLDHALSWTDQTGVSLAYNGTAPDLGAFEM